jgi:hypothetical protein
VREIAARLRKPVALLQDLSGPKIRTGKVREGAELVNGARIAITTEPIAEGNAELISTTYEALPRDVKPGDRVLLDDGNLELRVVRSAGPRVECEVVDGGPLRSNKGINLPGVALSTPALTDKDRRDLAFGLEHGVDFLALSFVRQAQDLEEARALVRAAGARTSIIAKIEKPQALDNLEDILASADGVMVARGDLGVELGTENVPIAQKRIIAAANNAGRVVITATQMLESMIENPRPTRAEASDVANAILDGTDAVMLSGESAVGKFPVETVETMARIALFTEEHGASSIRRRDTRPQRPLARAAGPRHADHAQPDARRLLRRRGARLQAGAVLHGVRDHGAPAGHAPAARAGRGGHAVGAGVPPAHAVLGRGAGARRPRGQHRRSALDRRAAAARARHRRERRHDPDAVRAHRRGRRDEHAARAHGGMKRRSASALVLGLLGPCSHNPNPKDYKFPPPELAARGTIVEGVASWYGPRLRRQEDRERREVRPGRPDGGPRLLGVRHAREGHLPEHGQERRRPHQRPLPVTQRTSDRLVEGGRQGHRPDRPRHRHGAPRGDRLAATVLWASRAPGPRAPRSRR